MLIIIYSLAPCFGLGAIKYSSFELYLKRLFFGSYFYAFSFLSFSFNTTSASLASCLLWVTTMTHLSFSWAAWRRMSMMSAAVVSSRLPVGSSAKIIGACETRARPIATRCCCPPESFMTLRWM